MLDVGFVGELQRRFLKVLAVQPEPVFLRPSCVLGVAMPWRSRIAFTCLGRGLLFHRGPWVAIDGLPLA